MFIVSIDVKAGSPAAAPSEKMLIVSVPASPLTVSAVDVVSVPVLSAVNVS